MDKTKETKRMNKMVKAASVLAVGLIVGCVTTSDRNDPVGQWQKDRFASDAIAALQKQNKLPSAADVSVKSSIGVVAAAAIINTFDAPFAAGYAKVVKNVDEAYAQGEGSIIYKDVADAAFDNKTSIDAEAAKLSAEDKKLFDDYVAYTKGLKTEDMDSTLKLIGDLLAQFAAGTAQVAGLAAQVKACPEFAALTGFAAVKEAKNLGTDLSDLKDQLASATTGLQLWKAQVEQNKKAHEYAIKH